MFNSLTGLETDKINQKLLIWQFIFNVTLSGQVGKGTPAYGNIHMYRQGAQEV